MIEFFIILFVLGIICIFTGLIVDWDWLFPSGIINTLIGVIGIFILLLIPFLNRNFLIKNTDNGREYTAELYEIREGAIILTNGEKITVIEGRNWEIKKVEKAEKE